MSTYLITGGAGFIGSNLVRELLERNETVRVLDNMATGRKENLEDIMDKIEFINGDFTNSEIAQTAAEGVDFIIHLGAIPSVQRSVENPERSHNSNTLGTLNMLLAARDKNVKRFVYAASSSAYGDSPIMPKREDMPTMPKSPYAAQKLMGEMYCKIFFQLFGLETVSLRFFNVFGPHQDPNSTYSAVIPLFIKKIAAGESPIIFGDGETSRDFTYVKNNVTACLLACKADKRCLGETINIACGGEYSLNQLVQYINKILNKDLKPVYKLERKGDVKHSLADISKAKELLGYDVTVDFEEGLRRTVEYYTKG